MGQGPKARPPRVEQWGQRRIDEPTPSDVERLIEYVKTHVVARRNARGGRSAGERMVAALRCLYPHPVANNLIVAGGNPALRVAKPRRLPSTRQRIGEHLPWVADQQISTHWLRHTTLTWVERN